MINSICVLVKRPTGEEKSAMGLRMAWAAHAGGFETTLVFMDDGVYNLIGTNEYNAEMLNNLIQEEGRVLCLQSSLDRRGRKSSEIMEGVETIQDDDLADLAAESDSVAVF